MIFNLDIFLTLVSLAIGILTLGFTFVKWNSSQINGRISRLEAEMDKKIETVRSDAKGDISVAFEMIKDMVREIREDVRWLMQNSKKD